MKRLIPRLALLLVTAFTLVYLMSAFRPHSDTPDPAAIVIKTLQIVNITSNSADCIFSVEDPQHLPKTLGVCIGKGPNPTTSNTRFGLAKATQGPVKYRSTMTGLTPNSTVHVRAYAIAGGSTVYGNDMVFTTAKPVK